MADGIGGKGPSAQTAINEHRCAVDRDVAAFNAAQAAQAEQMARELELDRERFDLQRQREEAEIALAKAQADEARARAEETRANAAERRASRGPAAPATATPRLLLFGGRDHKTFLGCFCDETEDDSVLNQYGKYGSRYSTGPSIFDHYGDFGSKYADTSVCNAYANEPPIVVSDSGAPVGYLTLNRYKQGAISEDQIVTWLSKTVCEEE